MPRIKKVVSKRNLDSYQVLIRDQSPFSDYFQIRELPDTFTGGKNGFLITGTEHLELDTHVLVEVLDANGDPVYTEPGKGIPEYYEGTSKVVACYVYEDTPIGIGSITILGELRTYVDGNGNTQQIPVEWQNKYNVKWNKSIYINNVLENETKVRFVKRPIIEVTEILKPIYQRQATQVTLSGSISGIPLVPSSGSDYRFVKDVLYRLETTSSFFTSSMREKTITVDGLPGFNSSGTYVTEILKIQSDTRAIARIPYYVTSSAGHQYVSPFSNKDGQITVESSPVYTNTAITGSFAKIRLRRMDTFAGDVQRVKLYYKSLNRPGDFQLISDQRLESTEVLRDESSRDLGERTGYFFSQDHINTYWTSGSLPGAPGTLTVSYDTATLLDSAKVSGSTTPNTTDTARYTFEPSSQFEVGEGVEYTIAFDLIGFRPDTTQEAKIEVYATGSPFTSSTSNEHGQLIRGFSLSGSTNSRYATFENVTENFKSLSDGSGSIKFVSYYGDWFISDVSVKASEDTSFSPDEVTFYLPIEADLTDETFIFRAEFFDINNNNIPVRVESDPITFDAGTTTADLVSRFEFNPSAFFFQFNSSSFATPPNQTINFQIVRENITGSVSFSSQSFDIDGNEVTPASPLTTQSDTSASLSVADFSGSANNIQRTVYTASIGALYTDYATIFKIQDSNPAQSFFLRTNRNSFTFDGDSGIADPTDQTASITATYQNITGSPAWSVNYDDGSSVDPSYFSSASDSLFLYVDSMTGMTGSINVTGSMSIFSDTITIIRTSNGLVGRHAPYALLDVTGPITFKSSSATGWEDLGPTYVTASFFVGPTQSNQEIWQIDLITGSKVLSASQVVDDAGVTDHITGSGTPLLTFRLASGSVQINQTFDVVLDSGQGPAGQDGITYTIEPTNVTFNANSEGFVAAASYSAEVSTVRVYAGNTEYQWSSSLGSQKFIIGTLTGSNVTVSQSVPSGPYVAITNLSNSTGYVQVPITYQDQYGNSSVTIFPMIRYNKVQDGGRGPSLAYIGDYFAISSSTPSRPLNNNPTVRDIVSSGSVGIEYYIFSGSDGTQIGSTSVLPTTGSDWELLQSYTAVATDLVLAQDIVVQKTVMIGTNSSGSGANVTLKGDTNSGSISIGQAAIAYGNEGIFMGMEDGSAKFSLLSGQNGIQWNGSTLSISGSGNFSGQVGAGSVVGSTITGGTMTATSMSGVDITIGSAPNVFKASGQGIWLGAADYASAPFRVDMAGNLTAATGTFGGIVTSQTFTPGGTGTGSWTGGHITSDGMTTGIIAVGGPNRVVIDGNAIAFQDLIGPPFTPVTLRQSDSDGLSINESVNVTGSVTATAFIGDGSSLTGIGGGGSVTSVSAGNGMSFTTITSTGAVTMGTPGTLTAATSNGVTTTSHTHAITTTTAGGASAIVATDGNGGTRLARLGVNVTVPSTDGKIEAGNDVVGFSSSDIRWKTNVKSIANALQKIGMIRGIEFDWIPDEKEHGYEGKDYGVVAQEIDAIMPEIVKTRDSGFMAVRYERLIPLLVEGIKELTDKVDELQAEIRELKGE